MAASRIIRIKNASGSTNTWIGQELSDGEYFTIPENELSFWVTSDNVLNSVSSGDLIVNNGADDTDDITDPIQGWRWLEGNILPLSALDGKKLSVHPSYKPIVPGSATYAVWSSAGDGVDGNGDIDPNGLLGDGPMTMFTLANGIPTSSVDVKFNPAHGRVWLHEAYIKFEDANFGDYLDGVIVAEGTPTQQSIQLNLNLDNDDWLTPATDFHLGQFNGTHGFADPNTVVLVPRTFSKDGDWDYSEINGLSPNYSGTGDYKITAVERVVHKYVNKVPCLGTTSYFSITSDETTELPKNYFLRVTAHNISNTSWTACVIMEIYRQRTYQP